jgi:nitric oxide dioxygenase
MSISVQSMKIVLATAPTVAANINAITQDFYPRMFAANPEAMRYFNRVNQAGSRQPRALADAVVASVTHLSNLAPLMPAFALIAHKHCALGIQAADYKIVHDNFLGATAHILGAAITAEVAAAWSEVLLHLAGALIGMESAIYDAAEKRAGGWRGKKAFVVTKIQQEAPGFNSVYFTTADGSLDPVWTPGQYLTLCENPLGDEHFAPRHYTISHHTKLRITVRKESSTKGHPAGIMSSFVHGLTVGSVLHFNPPMGTFTRQGVPTSAPEVFISGGSGITPICAMASEAAHQSAAGEVKKTILLVHVGDTAPLFEETSALVHAHASSSSVTLRCRREGVKQLGCIVAAACVDLKEAHFFVSGGPEMMLATGSALASVGIDQANVHYEAFGPKIDIFADMGASAGAVCPMRPMNK